MVLEAHFTVGVWVWVLVCVWGLLVGWFLVLFSCKVLYEMFETFSERSKDF